MTTTSNRSYLTLLAGVLAVGLLLIGGLSLAIYYALTDHPTTTAATDGVPAADTAVAVGVRDRIAAAPMLATTAADATGGTPALGALPEITIPLVAEIGPEGIPAGYPHTPEGSVGQLGEILVSVLGSMDLAHAQRVQQAWFEDPTADGVWPVLGLIQSFLEAGRMPSGLDPAASLRVIPAAGQIKGSDGDDWHVACVLVEITYTYRDQARLAYGHCERMTWDGQRWLIAQGAHPVPGPSTWPGTEQALRAGWLTWRDA